MPKHTRSERINKLVATKDHDEFCLCSPCRNLRKIKKEQNPNLPINPKLSCIIADPPWEYRHKVTGRNGRGAASHHYPTLSIQELIDFKLPDIADDAFLWMWVTNPIMAEGSHSAIIRAWGFKPQSILTWVKPGIGMGYTLRSASEHLIVARRGHPKVKNRSVPSWFSAKRLPHSQKPEEARRIIESICDGPYVEMFARRITAGWTCIGNQLPKIHG